MDAWLSPGQQRLAACLMHQDSSSSERDGTPRRVVGFMADTSLATTPTSAHRPQQLEEQPSVLSDALQHAAFPTPLHLDPAGAGGREAGVEPAPLGAGEQHTAPSAWLSAHLGAGQGLLPGRQRNPGLEIPT